MCHSLPRGKTPMPFPPSVHLTAKFFCGLHAYSKGKVPASGVQWLKPPEGDQSFCVFYWTCGCFQYLTIEHNALMNILIHLAVSTWMVHLWDKFLKLNFRGKRSVHLTCVCVCWLLSSPHHSQNNREVDRSLFETGNLLQGCYDSFGHKQQKSILVS